ncbi:hypothetical protein HMPREF1979_01632 [Actinomyces johnsonii F0542]|uniref:Uncharacterized protein n=1 Tax=Actinomyces johnsonii F0542 TaxID=1321818 RepID=U1RW54_9ACTO|nr:hypothetical protein HMPREF1979_01632 [Actinomyces johnsonii F0542]
MSARAETSCAHGDRDLPLSASMAPVQQHAAPTTSPVEPGATRRAQFCTHACARGAAWNR